MCSKGISAVFCVTCEILRWAQGDKGKCPPECSEGFVALGSEMLRWAQGDKTLLANDSGNGKGRENKRPRQGDHKGTPLLCLRSALPGSSIVVALRVGPGCGGNRLFIAFASKV